MVLLLFLLSLFFFFFFGNSMFHGTEFDSFDLIKLFDSPENIHAYNCYEIMSKMLHITLNGMRNANIFPFVVYLYTKIHYR